MKLKVGLIRNAKLSRDEITVISDRGTQISSCITDYEYETLSKQEIVRKVVEDINSGLQALYLYGDGE